MWDSLGCFPPTLPVSLAPPPTATMHPLCPFSFKVTRTNEIAPSAFETAQVAVASGHGQSDSPLLVPVDPDSDISGIAGRPGHRYCLKKPRQSTVRGFIKGSTCYGYGYGGVALSPSGLCTSVFFNSIDHGDSCVQASTSKHRGRPPRVVSGTCHLSYFLTVFCFMLNGVRFPAPFPRIVILADTTVSLDARDDSRLVAAPKRRLSRQLGLF